MEPVLLYTARVRRSLNQVGDAARRPGTRKRWSTTKATAARCCSASTSRLLYSPASPVF
jgi:hypothetical protein